MFLNERVCGLDFVTLRLFTKGYFFYLFFKETENLQCLHAFCFFLKHRKRVEIQDKIVKITLENTV